MEAYAYGKANMDSTNLTHMIQEEKISEDFDEKPFIFEVESNSTKNGKNYRNKSNKDQIDLATITSNSKNYEGGGKIRKTKTKQAKQEWDLDAKSKSESEDSEESGSAASEEEEEENASSSEKNDSEEEESQSKTEDVEGWQQLEGRALPYPTEIARQFVAGLKVGQHCENNHPYENPLHSIGLKLSDSISTEKSLENFFSLQVQQFKCQDPTCDVGIGQCINTLSFLPKVLALDIKFDPENTKEKGINPVQFKIAEQIDLAGYLNPLVEDFDKLDTKYEIFGIIALDTLKNGTYQTIVKKRDNEQKKNQWVHYIDGQYMYMTNTEALNSFYPAVLFYRILDEKRDYFTYDGFAVPKKPSTPNTILLDDWSDVAPLAKTVPFDEVSENKKKMLEKLAHLEK